MPDQPIRIGVVGAGAITRQRHLPGFQKIPGVRVTGVVNRSEESSRAVASDFGIDTVYRDWRALVDDPNIDAVVIGTWPYLHCEVTCAALAAGKHVLCEARMACNLAEANQMLAASKAAPNLIAQLVPSPYGLVCGPAIEQILDEGFIGEVRELVVLGADDQFFDYSTPLHWRQLQEYCGKNLLSLGILHETALRWAPPPTRVFAQTTLCEPERPIPEECRTVMTDVPDSVQVLTHLEGGGRGIYHQSGSILFGPGKQIHLYGSRSTIKVEFLPDGTERLHLAYAGEPVLREVEIPEDQRGGWRVEQEFIAAIRGEEEIRLNDFETGVKYMQFIDAVAESAASSQPVSLPSPG